ncbi:MAG: hypothetical protein HY711_10095, partial [Candidatus Melainabacteria bacterium]|nr:hypothetical protein [Candidatus Melainabacteria bacterium]
TQFLKSTEPVLAMVPRKQFQQLPYDVLEQIRVIDSRPFMSHSLNPGYIMQHRGQLSSEEPLLLLSNKK